MRVLPVGDAALLVEVDSAEEALAVSTAVRRKLEAVGLDVEEVVPAARTVLLDGVRDREAGLRLLSQVEAAPTAPASGGEPVVVPTRYDGEDLEGVARTWDMTRDEVVATHTGTTFTVAFCGFAPGFAYCTGLPERLSVPRLERPRPRVPAGSVGVAGALTGVYPRSSPGGWRLLGRTDTILWDPTAPQPALLSPGTRVRFEEVR